MENLAFKLETFEGPLDLLLHLINKNKMDICSVSLSVITEQYLQYVSEMKQMNIEMSSEFLVVAAQLLLIKSRSLLPKKQAEDDEEDLAEQLAERLLEYQKFKRVSEYLSQMSGADDYSYIKQPSFIEPLVEDKTLNSITTDKLFNAFMLIYNKKNDEKDSLDNEVFEDITARAKISIFSKVKHILKLIQEQGQLGFYDFFKQLHSKNEMVAGFLAVLELLKLNRIDIVEFGDDIIMVGGNKYEN